MCFYNLALYIEHRTAFLRCNDVAIIGGSFFIGGVVVNVGNFVVVVRGRIVLCTSTACRFVIGRLQKSLSQQWPLRFDVLLPITA
jgi:hypothetical protein